MSFRQLMVPDIDFIAITSSLKSAGAWLAGIVSIENEQVDLRQWMAISIKRAVWGRFKLC